MLGICSANRHRPAVGIFRRLAGGPRSDLIGIWSACCQRPAIKPTGILRSGRWHFAAFRPRNLPLNAVIGPTSGRCRIVSWVSFLLRSTYDVLPSPVNLVRWKLQEVDWCRCGKLGTMKHILWNCHLALSRYTWRHNEVLKVLIKMAKEQVEEGKYAPKPQKHGLVKIDFVPQRRQSSWQTEGKRNHGTPK